MNMKDKHPTHELTFKVDETSQGYLAQGIEIPEIILEVPTKKDLVKYLASAITCYFESFPEQHDIIFREESPVIEYTIVEDESKIIKIPVTV